MVMRNAFADLAEDATLADVVHLLAMIVTKLPERDGPRELVSAVVTSAPSTAVTGTVTANQGTAAATPWPVSLPAVLGLDQHYASLSAFAGIRSRITVA